MKYAWKKNGYKAQLRHETIAKDTGLCRATIKTAIAKLVKLNIISDIRGRSGKTYIVNDTFLKAENTYDKPQIAKYSAPDSQLSATLVEDNIHNNISRIVKSLAGNREKMIEELSKLPVEELKQDKTVEAMAWQYNIIKNTNRAIVFRDGKFEVIENEI